MSAKELLDCVQTASVPLQLTIIALLFFRRVYRDQPFFVALMMLCAVEQFVGVLLLFHRSLTGLSKIQAFHVYFYTQTGGSMLQMVLILLSIYSIFSSLMRPLPGLQRLGGVVFRWVGGISVLLTIMVACAPHGSPYSFFSAMVGRVQEAESILMLCLLLFVSLATKPLGLEYRSYLFGVTLGLGVSATASLVQVPWIPNGSVGMYHPVHLITSFGSLSALGIWTFYLARPEPARKMILLPTTSPFFAWNRISEALGSHPGYVAVGGLAPTMFAPAELAAFSAAPSKAVTSDERAPVLVMPQAVKR